MFTLLAEELEIGNLEEKREEKNITQHTKQPNTDLIQTDVRHSGKGFRVSRRGKSHDRLVHPPSLGVLLWILEQRHRLGG